MATKKIRAAVLGASGYTGADLIRLAARHPNITLTALIAKGHAGQPLGQVFPHLASLNLPKLVTSDEVDWSMIDLVVCGLPHGTAHQEIAKLPERIKIIDMSADFRLNDLKTYAEWYGGNHGAPELTKEAVYGLTEHYGEKLKGARIVACRLYRRVGRGDEAHPGESSALSALRSGEDAGAGLATARRQANDRRRKRPERGKVNRLEA